MGSYSIVQANQIKDECAGSDVPGEFRRLTSALMCDQMALTFISVPPHSDFEQSTGHYHDELEEIYIITRGTLTMRFDDDICKVLAGSAVRVAPQTKRSHRNEGEEQVDMWALSKKLDHPDATKIDDFWEASELAKQSSAADTQTNDVGELLANQNLNDYTDDRDTSDGQLISK